MEMQNEYTDSTLTYVKCGRNMYNKMDRCSSTLNKPFMHTFRIKGILQKHLCDWIIWGLTVLFYENAMRKIRLIANLSIMNDTLVYFRSVWNSPLFTAQFWIYQKTPAYNKNQIHTQISVALLQNRNTLQSLSYISDIFQQSMGYSVFCCMKTVAFLPLGTFYCYSQAISAVLNKMAYYGYGYGYIKAGKSIPFNKQIEIQN